jgi:hypothetical protein
MAHVYLDVLCVCKVISRRTENFYIMWKKTKCGAKNKLFTRHTFIFFTHDNFFFIAKLSLHI